MVEQYSIYVCILYILFHLVICVLFDNNHSDRCKVISHGILTCISLMCLLDQSCLTIYDPTGCSLPGFSVHGMLQARILEWVAIPFSRGSNLSLLHCRQILYHVSHQESLMIRNVENLFMCLLVIYISSLKKISIQLFCLLCDWILCVDIKLYELLVCIG